MAYGHDRADRLTPSSPPAGRLTSRWLTDVLAPASEGAPGPVVLDVHAQPLGTGVGLLGTLQRLDLTWSAGGGPASVVVKGPAIAERTLDVAARFDLYRTEVCFYRDLAAATGMAVPCHHAEIDERTQDFVIVLDDLSDAVALDQVVGCPPDRAAAVVAALADLHARHWDGVDLSSAPWLRRLDHRDLVEAFQGAVRATWPQVRARSSSDLDESVVALGDRLAELVPGMAAVLARPPVTLVHGDARLDNVFFAAGERVALCDWQLTGLSRGVRDLAYFLTQSLSPADRAVWERPLVEAYVARLAAQGVAGYGADQAWDDYRAATLLGLVYAVVAGGALDQASPRSRELTHAMLQRAAAAAVDHDCASLG